MRLTIIYAYLFRCNTDDNEAGSSYGCGS
uniref:Uncharacterized protein n=1 Tax=Arundo donax TaxID=35708 RepID=A0A0A9AC71_ARUDO